MKKNACCVIVVSLTSCLRAWTKILQIPYKRRRNSQRYVLMHIAFGNFLRQCAKKIVMTKIKKKMKGHWRSILLQRIILILLWSRSMIKEEKEQSLLVPCWNRSDRSDQGTTQREQKVLPTAIKARESFI